MLELRRIEKVVGIAASRSRVWQAIANSEVFGTWFGVKIHGPWKVGAAMRGTFERGLDQAMLDGMLQKMGLEPVKVANPLPEAFCTVERIEPETRFSFRWIPFGIDAGLDLETEPKTLVEFTLQDDGDGTRVSIVESGFEAVPEHRRQRAYMMNSGGWSAQAENLRKHVERT